ncbi:MAG: SDR family oxidoreductase [Bacteroidota bacterium]|nr:SDR family oxidoreductase [Bacteroidota bacterium]
MFENRFHNNDISRTSFLVTGGAGFIGSNIVRYLIDNGAGLVRVLDNFATGYLENIIPYSQNKNFELKKGDIRNEDDCSEATKDIDVVFHTAALGSVPRSLANPMLTNEVNASGFVNILFACHNNGVKRIVFSSSSSIYGLNKDLPVKESYLPMPISPYAVSKYTNELYAQVFQRNYGLEFIGLRYFNVFGPNQNINGPYAAVIPVFINSILEGKSPVINGDGFTSRDFTFVENVVQANVKAALTNNKEAVNQIYNISGGHMVSLNETFWNIVHRLESNIKPKYGPERKGDIKNSLADISKAKKLLNYQPTINFEQGMEITIDWFKEKFVFAEK